jgi:hypothetical protein
MDINSNASSLSASTATDAADFFPWSLFHPFWSLILSTASHHHLMDVRSLLLQYQNCNLGTMSHFSAIAVSCTSSRGSSTSSSSCCSSSSSSNCRWLYCPASESSSCSCASESGFSSSSSSSSIPSMFSSPVSVLSCHCCPLLCPRNCCLTTFCKQP